MLKAGTLVYRVELQSVTTTFTDARDPKQTPTTYATRWANVEPVVSGEAEQADGISATTTHKVTLRYFDELQHDHAVLWKSQELNIESVLHDENNQVTTALCRIKEGA